MNRRHVLSLLAAQTTLWAAGPLGAAQTPRRILSSSVTLTGTALAIGAPVVASAGAVDGRFFAQWSAEAEARGVERLWPAGRVDLEAVLAVRPDLILISASGADSALAQQAALARIAPVVVLDYARQPWQALATDMARATAREPEAAALLDEYDRWIAAERARLNRPGGPANIISYNGPGLPNPVATAGGAHGQLLGSLGFEIEGPHPDWHGATAQQTEGADFTRVAYEYLPTLTAPTTFLMNAGAERVTAFLADPLLQNLPSVRARQVYALGENSFRIDYYSAREIVTRLVRDLSTRTAG